ncbi:MAG: TolC family protein [Cytophagales bacterium]|nr:TolC family protein [Cytophagales bacterium]
MIKAVVLLLFFLSTISTAIAQSNALDTYVQSALESNLALQQKEYSYEKSLEALNEAKRMFLPTVSFETSYSQVEGGRTVELPIGDFINPIYGNLNQINQTLDPSAPAYPQLENPKFSFIRSSEQESKVVAAMPVFNASIIQNHKIKKGLVEVGKISVDIYKRELVKEVKDAYVKYLQAERTHALYTQTLTTVNESLRNRESLFTNDKITIDEVYAARVQVKEVERDLAEAEKNKLIAISWFNFLLNREFDSEIVVEPKVIVTITDYNLDDQQSASLSNREELR